MKKAIRLLLAIGFLQQSIPANTVANDFLFFEEEAHITAASQYPQKISDAPASAYVITAADIERYGYRTVGEALQNIPGIYTTSDRNYSYVWMRGFGRPSDYNNRILLLIDGHRINDHVYGGAYIRHEFSVDIKAIQHIEVIKGPASALHGDSAFFGVVNVVTKKAGNAPLIEAAAEGGSYRTHREFVAVAPEFKNGAKAYFSGSYRHMDGQSLYYPEYGGSSLRASDEETSATFFGQISHAGFTFTENSSKRTKHIPTGAYSTIFNNSGTRTTDIWSYVDLKGDHQIFPQVQLISRAYYDWYDYIGHYVFDGAVPPETLDNVDIVQARSYGQELRARLTFWGEKNSLTIGQEFEQTTRGHQANYYPGSPRDIDINTTPQRWAVYAQQELQPYNKLSLTLGIRRDDYETFGHTVNPRFAAIHKLWTDSVIKLLYGTAFRAPSAYEMFYGAATTFVPNPDLKPEKIRSYEAVWEQQFAKSGVVQVSAYHNRVGSLIDQTVLPDTRIQFQNRSAIKSRGMELYSKWAWNKALTTFAGYNIQKTRDDNGNDLSNSPKHSGSAGVSFFAERTKTTLSVQGFFIGHRNTLQGARLKSADLFSITARQPMFKHGTLYVSVYNAFNDDYRVVGAGEHVQDSILQDRRNFTAGLEYKFR